MQSTNDNPLASAILSTLLEAKQAGVGKLTRTALMKYVYLLDVFMAEETEGQTWTGAQWIFHHFGPYAHSVSEELTNLVFRSFISENTINKKTQDYFLYSIAEWSPAKTFEALQIPLDVRLKLINSLKKFGNDLPSLLNMVYFETEPMRNVHPGGQLSFAALKKVKYKTDIKSISIPAADKKKNARIRELIHAIGQDYIKNNQNKTLSPEPIRDSYFEQALLSDEDDPISGDFNADLSFD